MLQFARDSWIVRSMLLLLVAGAVLAWGQPVHAVGAARGQDAGAQARARPVDDRRPADAAKSEKPEGKPNMARPDAAGGPTRVRVAIWVQNIDDIDSAKQHFTASVGVALRWQDPRLAAPDGETYRYALDEIWHPRVQILQEIGYVNRTMPEVIEVAPDGTAVYRQRYVGDFSQPMMLNEFPFDRHEFHLHFVAVGYSPGQVEFVPDERAVAAGMENAAGIAKSLSLPEWSVESVSAGPLPFEAAPGMIHAGYALRFVAARRQSYFVWKVFMPMILITMMSWTVFWMDPEEGDSQLTVAVTAMLTLIAYRFVIEGYEPHVSYMTRIDWFMQGATVLLFLTVVEVVAEMRMIKQGRGAGVALLDRASRWLFPMAFVGTGVFALWGPV